MDGNDNGINSTRGTGRYQYCWNILLNRDKNVYKEDQRTCGAEEDIRGPLQVRVYLHLLDFLLLYYCCLRVIVFSVLYKRELPKVGSRGGEEELPLFPVSTNHGRISIINCSVD